MNSIGHEQLTVSTTAVSLTVPTGTHPKHALIQCGATNGVRWRADKTAPTSTVGIALAADSVLDLTDPMGNYSGLIDNIQFIRSGGADATLDIEYFSCRGCGTGCGGCECAGRSGAGSGCGKCA